MKRVNWNPEELRWDRGGPNLRVRRKGNINLSLMGKKAAAGGRKGERGATEFEGAKRETSASVVRKEKRSGYSNATG